MSSYSVLLGFGREHHVGFFAKLPRLPSPEDRLISWVLILKLLVILMLLHPFVSETRATWFFPSCPVSDFSSMFSTP